MKYFGGKVFDGKGVAELSYSSGRHPSYIGLETTRNCKR